MGGEVPLNEAADILSGRYLPADEYDSSGEYVIYGSNSIMGRASKASHTGPLVIFARVGSNAGAVMYSEKSAWVNNNAAALRAKEGWNNRYLYYWALHFDLRTIAQGSGQPFISNQALNAVRLIRRELGEQKAIASVLGALDEKIELNRRMNETLEAMARAIFKDWFVDFGPTRAKMAMRGEDPQKENVARAPYLAADLWSLFPDRLDDDGKPEGWKQSTVGAEFNLTMGQSPPGESYNDTGDGLPFFQGRTDFGLRYPVRRKFCSAPKRIAHPDDTLVSVRAPVGDLNMAWEECCIGRGVAAVRHKLGGRGYTHYAMKFMQPAISRFEDSGSVFGAINKVQFEQLHLIAHPPHLVEAFEKIVHPMDDRIRNNTSESAALAATRDLLLPKLMSGEVRIREAEKIVEDSV